MNLFGLCCVCHTIQQGMDVKSYVRNQKNLEKKQKSDSHDVSCGYYTRDKPDISVKFKWLCENFKHLQFNYSAKIHSMSLMSQKL